MSENLERGEESNTSRPYEFEGFASNVAQIGRGVGSGPPPLGPYSVPGSDGSLNGDVMSNDAFSMTCIILTYKTRHIQFLISIQRCTFF